MNFFNHNIAIKTISTMCAAGALLASQAVFAGSDADSKSAKIDNEPSGTYTSDVTYTAQEAFNADSLDDDTESEEMNTAGSQEAENSSDRDSNIASSEKSERNADREDRTAGVDAGTSTAANKPNFNDADSNSDTRLDRNEFGTANEEELSNAGWGQDESFDEYDLNDDGSLDQEEYDSYSADLQSNERNRSVSIEADE